MAKYIKQDKREGLEQNDTGARPKIRGQAGLNTGYAKAHTANGNAAKAIEAKPSLATGDHRETTGRPLGDHRETIGAHGREVCGSLLLSTSARTPIGQHYLRNRSIIRA